MNPITLIREEIQTAHEWFDATMAGVTDEVAHWQPGGTAHPIGSRYAHMVVTEDMMVNGLLKGSAPLFATSWAGKTGLEDPQAAFYTTLEWAQRVKVDLDALDAYAQAVYASTDAYLATLGEDDLEGTIDLTEQNLGTWSVGAFLLSFVFGHVRDIMGEISALKGLRGLQGYPF
jgi:hypothetical protein